MYDDQGTVLAASPNIAGKPPIYEGVAPTGAPELQILRRAPDDDEAEDYRVWVMGVDTATGPVTVLAGASLESVSEASRTLRRDLVVGVPLLIGLVALGTWVVIGRTLRPVEDIRTEVAAIGDDQLDRRVPVPAADDEISRLAVTMNQMLPGSRTRAVGSGRSLPTPPTSCRARSRPCARSSRSPWRTRRTTGQVWPPGCWGTPTRWNGWYATCCSSPEPRPRTAWAARTSSTSTTW